MGRSNSLLSPRLLEVLDLVRRGHSAKQIADALRISKHTTYEYYNDICHRLGAQSLAEAVAIAYDKGLFPPPSAGHAGGGGGIVPYEQD